MLTYLDLQNEVARRSTRDQSGTQFTTAIKNIINLSLFRISREAPWRSMRRKGTFTTVASYTTCTNAAIVANSATSVTITGVTMLTDKVNIGRRAKFGTDAHYYTVKAISAESVLHLDRKYEGTSSTATSYEILPQCEYNLPIQAGHRMFMWHEDYGYPYKMFYIPDQTFYETGVVVTDKNTPTHYRMWGEDMVIAQPGSASPLTIYSSSASDLSIPVTIFGTVNGYPDYEVRNTSSVSGTTPVTTTNFFSYVERVSKSSSSYGRLTITTYDSLTNIAIIPVGDTTAGVLYKKVQLYPLPTRVFDINVQYYKDPMRLVNDGDIHELGQEFDEAIILLSCAKIQYETSQAEGDRFYSMYTDEIRNLKKTNVDKIDWFPTLLRPKHSRSDGFVCRGLMYKQVGPNFGPRV